jgi:DNA-binding CsgD family transcriptional regulator
MVRNHPCEALTRRERGVLGLAALDNGDEQIAAQLGISRHTVSMHMRSAFKKLRVHSRAGAVGLLLRWTAERTANPLARSGNGKRPAKA